MKISYAVTVCNELEEIVRLLDFLLQHKRAEDEIVVLMDVTKATDELVSTLRHYEMHNMDDMVVWAQEFKGHFADWKNKLTSYCSGDFIFQIDADELPNVWLMENLHSILDSNPELEVYLVPRINVVTGLTEEHIRRWGWNVNEKGWVNFPDHQWRIYKNDPKIKWVNKVHERLDGFKQYSFLPSDEEFTLTHFKTIERQERQNAYYDTL